MDRITGGNVQWHTLGKSEAFLTKLNLHLPHGLTNTLLGTCAREMETDIHTKTCTDGQLYTQCPQIGTN